jgi:hypothetical protein
MTMPPLVVPPRGVTSMSPFFREATVNRETTLALLQPLSDEQLAWRPAEKRWSIAEVCTHMAKATALYVTALDDAVRAGHASGAYTDRPYAGSLLARILVWSMEPPPRFRMPSPRDLRPDTTWAPAEARHRYLVAQQDLLSLLDRAAGLDLKNVRVRVPEPPRSRLALGTVLAFLLAHERRHLWQATAVRNTDGFPTA